MFKSYRDGTLKYFELPSTSNVNIPLFAWEDFGDDDILSCRPIDCSALETAAADKLPVISRRQRSFSDILCCVAKTKIN